MQVISHCGHSRLDGGHSTTPGRASDIHSLPGCKEYTPAQWGAVVAYDCNKLGERPASETGSTDDGLLGSSKNKHYPVMVYNDLMIRNNTVRDYNKNRSQPVTTQCPITWVGAPVDRLGLVYLA